jgi:hypothetical protein
MAGKLNAIMAGKLNAIMADELNWSHEWWADTNHLECATLGGNEGHPREIRRK